MKRAQTTFAAWVKTYGAGKLSKELGVSESTIRHWAAGRRLPRAEEMSTIRDISGGRVSADQMIQFHLLWKACR